jgi:CubicO group peptidase (beta-lactamase class C family)/enterochelin esterase-like enzyme
MNLAHGSMQVVRRTLVALIGVLMLGPGSMGAEPRTLTAGTAKEVGFDAERLDRALKFVEESVTAGRLTGAIVLVARRGVVVAERAYGVLDLESKRPCTTETIYPIASISKPMTATAVMILVDEGRLGLSDPVERYLPAFKEQKLKTPAGDLVHRPFTVRHLLTHTAGLPSNSPLRKLPLREWLKLPLSQTVDAAATVDLDNEPGTKLHYSAIGFATLGRIVEVISGRPFEQFMTERVFEPLGMRHTFYNVPRPLADGVARGMFFRMKDGKFDGFDPHEPDFKIVNTMPNAGVFTTAHDLAVFYQMFLNGGTYGGRRLLSAATVRMMLADQTTKAVLADPTSRASDRWGLSWVLGTGRRDKGVPVHSEQIFSHLGSSGCYVWGDPVEGLIGSVHMVAEAGAGGMSGEEFRERFQHMIYAALEDPQGGSRADRPSPSPLGAEGPKPPGGSNLGAATVLEVGKTIERRLGKGEVHAYPITLEAGQYLHAVLKRKELPLEVTAYGPDGRKYRLHTDPYTSPDTLHLHLVAEATGPYRLELRGEEGAEGVYAIGLDELLTLSERLRPPDVVEKYRSPRLLSLRRALDAGDRDALGRFWREVAERGAPLVEPLDGDNDYVLVTFLWRARFETRNVVVVHWARFYSLDRLDDYKMVRLGDTDLWYRTLRIRRDARFVYRLSPNDPLRFGGTADAQRGASAQADPLNPRRWPDADSRQSLLELPGAPPQPWVVRRTGVPAGTVQKHRLASPRLGNERDIFVYTPAGYDKSTGSLALLVLFDAKDRLSDAGVPTPVILDNLMAEGRIPPMVAVLIANPTPQARSRELPCNPDFAEFLHRELIPWVGERYRITSDPGRRIISGASYGALAATYAALRHPETFGNVLAQSGSFRWDPAPHEDGERNFLARQFVAAAKLPIRFYLDAGLDEMPLVNRGGGILEESRHLRDVLRAKGYEVHYQEFAGGHDEVNWRVTFPDGLIALIGQKRSLEQSPKTRSERQTPPSTSPHDARIGGNRP